VSGNWTTPSVTCNAEDQIITNWIGLDGFNSNSVEQLGTISWCFQGKPVYFTWFEMFPGNVTEVGKSLAPGDKIAASVTRSGTSYTLKLTDSTHPANSFTRTATCALTKCLDTSAEWISERPSFSIGIVPQAHYNAFKITNGSQTSSGHTGTIGAGPGVNALTMVDATGTYNLNTVSTLTGGNSFSTTWKNSYYPRPAANPQLTAGPGDGQRRRRAPAAWCAAPPAPVPGGLTGQGGGDNLTRDRCLRRRHTLTPSWRETWCAFYCATTGPTRCQGGNKHQEAS